MAGRLAPLSEDQVGKLDKVSSSGLFICDHFAFGLLTLARSLARRSVCGTGGQSPIPVHQPSSSHLPYLIIRRFATTKASYSTEYYLTSSSTLYCLATCHQDSHPFPFNIPFMALHIKVIPVTRYALLPWYNSYCLLASLVFSFSLSVSTSRATPRPRRRRAS